MRIPTCAECGSPMVLKASAKYRYKSGEKRKFWGCSQFPKCHGVHGAHPNGRPVGIPADKATKLARMAAHAVFDEWWHINKIERGYAYKKLEEILGLQKDECHIGKFTKEQCQLVIDKIGELQKQT